MSELISIIILNFNGKRFLKECIDSILAQTYAEFEIILFDNASSDASVEFIKTQFNDSRIKIFESKTNLGFARGNNEALKHCSSDIIVLLNNDTIVDKNWLKYLVDSVSDGNTVASSFVITQGIPEKYYQTNGSVSYLMYNIMNVFDNNDEIFYPNGCSLIFRKSEIGEPFDSDYFYYGEDVYLGLKARFSGMKIKFVNNSVVHHIGEGSKTSSLQKTFFAERNRFLNLYSFFSISFIVKLLPYFFLYFIVNILFSLISKKKSIIGLVKANFWLIINFKKIIEKRKLISKIKIVDEKEIIKYISCKIFNNELLICKLINRISYIYSRLVNIKSIEYFLN